MPVADFERWVRAYDGSAQMRREPAELLYRQQ